MGLKYPAEPITTDKLSPAPDTYNVRKEEIIVPARSFGRAPRSMSAPRTDYPGPGAYPVNSFLDLSMKDKSNKKTKPLREKSDKSKIDTPGPTSYNPKKLSTNISFSMGNKTFSLISPNSSLIGPGQYNANYDSIKPSTAISFSRASRSPLAPSTNVPGPGTHSLREIKECPQYVFPREPRGKRNSPDYPGPGEYNIPGLTDELKHKMGKTILPRRPLIIKDSGAPGPGAYDAKDQNSAPSFSVGKGKRPKIPGITKNPGPGVYSPVNPNHTIHSKSIGASTRPPLSKTNGVPGPGAYDFKTFTEDGPKYTTVGRKPEIKGNTTVPGPGQYNPEIVACRPEGVHVVIGTGQRTNESRRGVRAPPGPGAYDPFVSSDEPKWTFKKDPREKANFEDEPGPGQYEIPPTVPDVPKYLLSNINRK